MKSFVACARITALTLFFTFMAFQVFAVFWTLALGSGTLWKFSVYGMLWLNQLTVAFIAIAAGWLAPRYERQHPMLIAAISAALVELLHASASGGFRFNPPLVTIGVTVLCGLVAAGVTRLRLLFPRPAPQEAVK